MKLVVLLSCMNQSKEIIQNSNIQTNVIVVNQCDHNSVEYIKFMNNSQKECLATFISTTERGLSRSRNMAISKAKEYDIGLFCDDDENLDDKYEESILDGYLKYPEADLIAFPFKGMATIPREAGKLSLRQLCSTSSIQLTIKLKSIIEKDIRFDTKMGSGTGNGAGEEVKFMMQCRKHNMKMYYCPTIIAELLPGESSWFNGRNEKYIRDTGWAARRSFGLLSGFLFINYHMFRHYSERYSEEMSFWKAYYYINKGFWEKR